MNHLPFALLAYFLNALSVLSSKFLLSKSIPDPLVYIFYISLISFLAAFALPFTNIPSFYTLTLASSSTLLWTSGAYFMFKALKIGHVSRVVPIIGTLISLFLLVFAMESKTISNTQILSVWFLLLGMVILTIAEWKGRLTRTEIIYEVLSALFFAVSYILLREAYLNLDFFSVMVWSRLILLPLGIIILIIPNLRRRILTTSSSSGVILGSGERAAPKSTDPGCSRTVQCGITRMTNSWIPKINFLSKQGLIFLGGQTSGAASEFLLLFSISLANPALVNSLQGTQYIFLLIFALILAKKYPEIFEEKYSFRILISKALGILLIGTGLYLLALSS